MLTELISGRHAWVKDDLVTEDWFVTLSEPCLSELQGVVQHLRRKPLGRNAPTLPVVTQRKAIVFSP